MDETRILSLLALIHEENEAIMTTILSMACYPQDYEKTKRHVEKEWGHAYQRIMRMGTEDEEEQSGKNDNNRATDSD